MIPVNEPLLNGNEVKYLAQCIETGWISSDFGIFGNLGGRVSTVSEAEFSITVARFLSAPKPDPHALAATVHARFGRETFVAGASAAFDRLTKAN
jgi:hypothetical protein